MDIKINIKNKIAELAEQARIVCGNSDYTAVFSFDIEWARHHTKTARFTHGSTYTDVVFTGNRCPIPVMRNTTGVYVGVYAGDISTTTPAYIGCEKSILCNGGTPAEPTPDVYAQLMALLAEINKGGTVVTLEGEMVETFPADAYIAARIAERIAELVNSAPTTLDTLAEVAKALGNDPNFATTILNEVGKKLDKIQNNTYQNAVYYIKPDGTHALWSLGSTPNPLGLVTFTGAGTLKTNNATEANDAVNLAQMNETLDERIGDISTALDELHAYAQALINGGAN